MTRTRPLSFQKQHSDENEREITVNVHTINPLLEPGSVEEDVSTRSTSVLPIQPAGQAERELSQAMEEGIEHRSTLKLQSALSTQEQAEEVEGIEHRSTLKLQSAQPLQEQKRAFQSPPPLVPGVSLKRPVLTRGRAVALAIFLLVLILNAANLGNSQFIGAQGWAYVLGGSSSSGNSNILKTVNTLLHPKATPGATVQPTQQITPQDYINLIVNHMTLDQKLGQMMIVQFVGPDYGLDISTMITQYNVGAVLIFTANNNIVSKPQLRGLIQQMQSGSSIPLAVAIDQEGGTVDRLASLDGTRPSATTIGQTNNLSKATAAGAQDASDLAYYGFNLNLAPVVDVNNVYNSQLYMRTFGTNPTLVTQMAAAYLRGLQASGKVLGTLKHFPGLGDVASDPHITVPRLTRSLSQLEAIDWAPYRALIQQGNVHAIMVTHEIVTAVDSSKPSSLSYKLVTGILRNQFGFNGVIMTDSLTMEGITAYYTEAQAAALAVEAGSDLLMGASTPNQVANMINGIKQAVVSGEISQQRIDDSVRRILMLKYDMGLLHIPTT